MSAVLVVDSSRDLLDMFSLMLKKHDFNCVTTDSTDGLYKQLQTNLPDILLMDTKLNGVDGREICKELKTRNAFKTIPIILMSSSSDKLKNYKKYNADAVLEKPFEMNNLFEVIDGLLHVH